MTRQQIRARVRADAFVRVNAAYGLEPRRARRKIARAWAKQDWRKRAALLTASCGILALTSLGVLTPPAHAQGSRKDDIVFNALARPMAGATVRVCTSSATGEPCSPLANIYSDTALTQAMANPLATDGLGNYSFYAAPGRYMIEISGPGITTKQIPNVILPNDPSTPTFTSLTTTSGISAFSLSLSGNLTVTGSTAVTGTLTVGGAPVPSTGQANTWTADQYFKSGNPWFDIKGFGAVCDGVTDDTTAIEAARAAAVAAHGGTVLFPPNSAGTACVYAPPASPYSNPGHYVTFLLEAPVIIKTRTWQIPNGYNIIGNPTGMNANAGVDFGGAILQISITPSPSSISPVIEVAHTMEATYIANIAVQNAGEDGIYVDQSDQAVLSNDSADSTNGDSSACALTLNSSFGYKVIDGTYIGSSAGTGTGGSICLTSTHVGDPFRIVSVFGTGPSSRTTLINKGIHISASVDQSGAAASNLKFDDILLEGMLESMFTIDTTNGLSLRTLYINDIVNSDPIGGGVTSPLITCPTTSAAITDIQISGISGNSDKVFSPNCDGRVSRVLINGPVGDGPSQAIGLTSGYVAMNFPTGGGVDFGSLFGASTDRSGADYVIQGNEFYIECGTNANYTLPDATASPGFTFIIKRNSTPNGEGCSVIPAMGQTIDGSGSNYLLTRTLDWLELHSDGGTDWRIWGTSIKPSYVVLPAFDFSTSVTTGDGAYFFPVPIGFAGKSLISVSAHVWTAGMTGSTTIQLAKCSAVATGSPCSGTVVDMLSTAINIDSNQEKSDTAAAQPVINSANATFSQDDVIRVDVDAVSSGTAPKGLTVTVGVQ